MARLGAGLSNRAQLRLHLDTLGMASRLAGKSLPDGDVRRLLRITRPLIEAITYEAGEPGQRLLIDHIEAAPNADGWIVGHMPVDPPYWLPKANFLSWRGLLFSLDDLAVSGRLSR